MKSQCLKNINNFIIEIVFFFFEKTKIVRKKTLVLDYINNNIGINEIYGLYGLYFFMKHSKYYLPIFRQHRYMVLSRNNKRDLATCSDNSIQLIIKMIIRMNTNFYKVLQICYESCFNYPLHIS